MVVADDDFFELTRWRRSLVDIQISLLDSAVLVAYIVLTLALGLWLGRGSQTLRGYLVGGRDLPWWAVLGSIIATETSAVTFLSVPGLAMAKGGDFGFLQLSFGLILGRLIVVAWLMPTYFRREIFTAYDILKSRFGVLTQRSASGIFIVTRTVADGLRLYLTALVLGQVTGIGLTVCVLLLSVTTVIYSALGGVKSVIWSDCIQLVVYLIGAVVAIGVIAGQLDLGFGQAIDFGWQTERFRVVDWSLRWDRPTLWAGVVGGMFLAIATHGTDQMMVQRYLCSRGPGQASLALAVSGPLVALQFALFLLVGVCLAAWYEQLKIPFPAKLDEAFANFIVERMPAGLCGLTLAAVFSVAMSTLSSSLSSSTSAVVNDFMKRDQTGARIDVEGVGVEGADVERAEDVRLTRASKLWTAAFGVLQMAVAIVVIHTPALLGSAVINQVITVAGFSSGLIVGIFLLGMTKRRFAQRSGLVGMLTALVVTVILIMPTGWLPWNLHGWWAAMVSSLVCFSVAMIVDVLFPLRVESADA
jgi:SSS family transporter